MINLKMGSYCLKCRQPNMRCKCGTKEFTFNYSHKLRVPLDYTKRSKFRKFLRDCPIFVNGVEDHLKPMFREFLRDLKFFNERLDGKDWTYVLRGKEEDKKYYNGISELAKEKMELYSKVCDTQSRFDIFKDALDTNDIEKIKEASSKLDKIIKMLDKEL